MRIPASKHLLPAIIAPPIAFLYYFQRHHSISYLAASSLLLLAFYFLYTMREGAGTRRIAIAAGLGIAIGITGLALWQFLQMQDPGDIDHSTYSCALWNMAHGSTYFSLDDTDIFATHSDYTALLWIPWQALTGEWGLKIGKCLCLIIASLLVACRFRNEKDIAAWAVAALLLSPPIASQFFNGFHVEFLAAPILVLALDAYREQRMRRFLIYTAILAYTKEIFTLAIGGVLLVALIEKRNWKWILLPGLLCTAQMAAFWFIILPHFAPQGNRLAGFMPGSVGEILSLWFRPQTLAYALTLLLPFLPLLLAYPKRYLLVPLPLMLFYSAFPSWIFESLATHYAFPIAFLCFAGFLLSEKKPELPLAKILLACAVTACLSYPIWRMRFSVPAPDFGRIQAERSIRALVPGDASVLVNAPFMARYAARKDVSDWTYRKKIPEAYDYVVMDRSFTPEFHVEKAQLEKDIAYLTGSPGWTVAFASGDLFLFRNDSSSRSAQ